MPVFGERDAVLPAGFLDTTLRAIFFLGAIGDHYIRRLYAPYNACMSALRVLHDGWPLAYRPQSAAAWHLRALLELSPANIEILLAVPAGLTGENLTARVQLIEASEKDRGKWEQRVLPDIAAKHAAAAIHTTGLAASLLGKVPTLVSPGETEDEGDRGRAAEAQGRGGLARAKTLWPQDAARPRLQGQFVELPPVVYPAFLQHTAVPTELGMPEEYLLYHGSGNEDVLMKLLESWTWAAASIGELYPLVLTGLSEPTKEKIQMRLPDFHLENYVQVKTISATDMPAVMQHCAAFVYPEMPAAWGNSLRLALACGKAIVAHQEPLTESIVGSAAYLIDANDLRSFGAATITVVVDEKAREPLQTQARQKSARWNADAFTKRLSEIYSELTPTS